MKLIRKFILFKLILAFFRYFNLIKTNYTVDSNINFGSEESNQFFIKKIKMSETYLEYGSGNSTIFADNHKINYFSIENDKNFYQYMNKQLINNKNFFFKDLGITYFNAHPVLFNIRKFFLKKKSQKYANDILIFFNNNNIVPDLVLIDGRYRVMCALFLYKFFKKNKKDFNIIVDDYLNRYRYHILNKFFKVKIVGRLGVLYSLKEADLREVDVFIEMYSLISR